MVSHEDGDRYGNSKLCSALVRGAWLAHGSTQDHDPLPIPMSEMKRAFMNRYELRAPLFILVVNGRVPAKSRHLSA